jgi:hypothetical protein
MWHDAPRRHPHLFPNVARRSAALSPTLHQCGTTLRGVTFSTSLPPAIPRHLSHPQTAVVHNAADPSELASLGEPVLQLVHPTAESPQLDANWHYDFTSAGSVPKVPSIRARYSSVLKNSKRLIGLFDAGLQVEPLDDFLMRGFGAVVLQVATMALPELDIGRAFGV